MIWNFQQIVWKRRGCSTLIQLMVPTTKKLFHVRKCMLNRQSPDRNLICMTMKSVGNNLMFNKKFSTKWILRRPLFSSCSQQQQWCIDEWKTKEENIDRKLRYRIKAFQSIETYSSMFFFSPFNLLLVFLHSSKHHTFSFEVLP